MRPRARVIALGQAAAGDDGVGLAVLEHLQREGLDDEIELLRAAEDAALIELLVTPSPVVLVDAVLREPSGQVLVLSPDDIEASGLTPVSTHGLGAGRAVALAHVLHPEDVSESIRIVAVTIARPTRYEQRLSPAVAAAVPQAAARVRSLIEV